MSDLFDYFENVPASCPQKAVPAPVAAAPTPAEMLKHVVVYTDGCCLKNPGRGGYGVILMFGDKRKELYKGFRRTTNNRMEVLAAIVALQALKERCQVTLHSDSAYLVNTISKGWAVRWQRNNWYLDKKGENPVKNADLWQLLLPLCRQHQVEFKWVRGHAGNTENERADVLSVMGANLAELLPDTAYESVPDKV